MPEDDRDVGSFRPTERFTSKVHDYALFRPKYPAALMHLLRDDAGMGPGKVVADIGSGTGILTEQMLREGCVVFAVEPNLAMRQKAEALLGGWKDFHSIDGRAEATTLPDGSMDLITVGQAFHWFEIGRTRVEFMRILRPRGCVCLVWNNRDPQGGAFEEEYQRLVKDCCPAVDKIKRLGPGEGEIDKFYGGQYLHTFLPNHQDLDEEGLKGRFISASYAPGPNDPGYKEAMVELEKMFRKHAENGLVRFHYMTEVFLGQFE